MHVDLKTAFLQGEAFDHTRDVVCQLPPECGQPPYIGARMVKPGYGLNDAPRRWWNEIDKSLRSYGLVPTRADRCCYVLHHKTPKNPSSVPAPQSTAQDTLTTAIDLLTDPIHGSPSLNKTTSGVVCLHVDDLFMTGDDEFIQRVYNRLIKTTRLVLRTRTMLNLLANASVGIRPNKNNVHISPSTRTRKLRNCPSLFGIRHLDMIYHVHQRCIHNTVVF